MRNNFWFILLTIFFFSCTENKSKDYLTLIQSSDSILEKYCYHARINFIYNLRYDGRNCDSERNIIKNMILLSEDYKISTQKDELLKLEFKLDSIIHDFPYLKPKKKSKYLTTYTMKEDFINFKYFTFKNINQRVMSPCLIFSRDLLLTPYDSLVSGDVLRLNEGLLNSVNYLIDSISVNGEKIYLDPKIDVYSNHLKNQILVKFQKSRIKSLGDTLVFTAYFQNEFGGIDSVKSNKLKVYY